MRKMTCLWLVLLLLIPAYRAGAMRAQEKCVLRALLISSDHFVTQEDTHPSAGNNVALIADTLMRDARGYSLVRTLKNSVGAVTELADAARAAFEGADGDDISLLYISTHGVLAEDGETALLLSDGEREEELSRDALYAALKDVPGKKILILDACYSGAFIGKGLGDVYAGNPFAGDDFCVLAASGGEEPAFYWRAADGRGDALRGGSYFATMLASALNGACAADLNRDGNVTMSEMLKYSLANYAPSTPQLYPQASDTVLFSRYVFMYAEDTRAVTDIVFDTVTLSDARREASFTFVVRRQTRVSYMLVYHRGGAWDFQGAQTLNDDETGRGTLLPGRKERTLTLSAVGTYGYVMVVLLTVDEDAVSVAGSGLLCVQGGGELAADVRVGDAFAPVRGGELSAFISHAMPCSLTVTVRDAQGNSVRRLLWRSPSRPQTHEEPGTCLYWDGTTASGDMAAPGQYYLDVVAASGERTVTLRSNAFWIL